MTFTIITSDNQYTGVCYAANNTRCKFSSAGIAIQDMVLNSCSQAQTSAFNLHSRSYNNDFNTVNWKDIWPIKKISFQQTYGISWGPRLITRDYRNTERSKSQEKWSFTTSRLISNIICRWHGCRSISTFSIIQYINDERGKLTLVEFRQLLPTLKTSKQTV